MKTKLATAIALVAGLLAVCAPVFAHHGNAAYDMSHVVVLKNAKVTQVLWANPHIVTFFDVTDKTGKVTHWAAEGGSPEAVFKQGWRSGTLQSGDMITTVRLFQAKDGRPIGRMGDFTLPNGRILDSFGGVEHPYGVGPAPDCSKGDVSGGSVSLGCIGKTKTKDSK